MKNKLLLSLAIMSCVAFTACGHEHTFSDATCTTPKTCTECGEVEGTSLGHTFADATCTTAKTCTVCGETEGNVAEHTWVEATCTTAKTCSVCSTTEGDALGHKWREATCTTAKTCSVCSTTEGEPVAHVWIEATTEAPKTCETCGLTDGDPITAQQPEIQEGTVAAIGLSDQDIDYYCELLNLSREKMLSLKEEKFKQLIKEARLANHRNNDDNNSSSNNSENSSDTGNAGGYESNPWGLPAFEGIPEEDVLPGRM